MCIKTRSGSGFTDNMCQDVIRIRPVTSKRIRVSPGSRIYVSRHDPDQSCYSKTDPTKVLIADPSYFISAQLKSSLVNV